MIETIFGFVLLALLFFSPQSYAEVPFKELVKPHTSVAVVVLSALLFQSSIRAIDLEVEKKKNYALQIVEEKTVDKVGIKIPAGFTLYEDKL